MDKKKEIRRFFLLQVNDALFPIGGYSHSQGLAELRLKTRTFDIAFIKRVKFAESHGN